MLTTDIMTSGPLRRHPDNPGYFTDDTGEAVWLTGSHTWATLQERRLEETPEFDYEAYLDWMVGFGHNFLRLWTWEHPTWMQFTDRRIRYYPTIYERTGPGEALDGEPRFDLTRFNDAWLTRLRQRVELAGRKGIYVSVMFFQGFSVDKTGGSPHQTIAFRSHPYNQHNNVNGLNGSPEFPDTGVQIHTLQVPEVTAYQKAFVGKVLDTVGDMDHVLYEIANEAHSGSVEWQHHLIDFVHEYESSRPKQHPVGITGSPLLLEDMVPSAAEWVSPGGKDGYAWEPPVWDGDRVCIVDTDHSNPWDSFKDPALPWKCLMRGLHFIVMDPYMDARFGSPRIPYPEFDDIRRQMGLALRWSRRIDLAAAAPSSSLCSSGYCLAIPGSQYLAYVSRTEPVTLDLSGNDGQFTVTWLNLATGEEVDGGTTDGGRQVELVPPFWGDGVCELKMWNLES